MAINPYLAISLIGALYLAITMGLRQTVGLYVPPIQASGFDIATISLAMAIGQLVWGLVQPVAGAIADRYGHLWVLVAGAIILALGNFLTPYWLSPLGLIITFGILAPIGSGIGSFSTLIGLSARATPINKRSMSSGIINAGGSFGQFIYAPLIQFLISSYDWMRAISFGAFSAFLAIPCAWLMHKFAKNAPDTSITNANNQAAANETLRQTLAKAVRNRDYGLLHLSFFTCGFHVAFLVTHLKVEVVTCHGLSENVAAYSIGLIGLMNIVGSLLAGYLGNQMKMKYILVGIYGIRALVVFIYLFMPKTSLTYYMFAAVLGLTWLATVPPTAGLVGKLLGVRYMATLFGLTLVSHQIGGFLGAYLGGLSMLNIGNYQWMWWADICLAIFASLVSLPIREQFNKAI